MMDVITAKIYAGKISHQKNRDQDIFSSCVVLIIIIIIIIIRVYRRHRKLLREKWEALHVSVIDLSEDVYTQ